MKLISVAAVSLLVLLTSVSGYSQTTPPSAVVTAVQIDGSGCDANSANAVMTTDLNYLSVLYDRFIAEIGQGTTNPNARAAEKQCTILVNINVPSGWTFDIDTIEYRGYVEVPNKLTLAYQLASATVSGNKGFGFEQSIMRGPKSGNYALLIKNRTPLGLLTQFNSQLNKQSCSKENQNVQVKIRSTIGVRNLVPAISKAAVRVVIDSTDATFRQNLKLNWKQCL